MAVPSVLALIFCVQFSIFIGIYTDSYEALGRQFGMGGMIDRFMAPGMVSSELEFGDLESARKYLEQVTVDEGNRNSMSFAARLMGSVIQMEASDAFHIETVGATSIDPMIESKLISDTPCISQYDRNVWLGTPVNIDNCIEKLSPLRTGIDGMKETLSPLSLFARSRLYARALLSCRLK